MEVKDGFNGGIMVHIFSTNLGKDRDPDDAATYVDTWFSEETHEALTSPDSKFFVKIDGSCGMLVRDPKDGQWQIYQRYDDKKNKFEDGESIPEGYMKVPVGVNPLSYQFTHGRVKHSYYMKLLDRNPKGKTETHIHRNLYAIVDARKDLEGDYLSVELCGRNFNQTPGVGEFAIALHSAQTLVEPLRRPDADTVEGWKAVLVDYVTRFPCEGIIVRHPNGKYYKILSRLLGVDHKKQYLPPKCL